MNLDIIREFVEDKLKDEGTGHDLLHINRVEKNALKIMETINLTQEEKDIVIASVLLHDIADYKVTDKVEKELIEIDNILTIAEVNSVEEKEIKEIINNISFSKNLDSKKELSELGMIVQDADRLDAIGAIGIARTFYYGGSKGSLFYDDKTPNSIVNIDESTYKKSSTVINHFYEKLLKLESLMNTTEAKIEARKRTNFMQEFLQNFFEEI